MSRITESLPCIICESLDIIEYEDIPDGERVWIKTPTFSTYEYETDGGETKQFSVCPKCKMVIIAVLEEYLENKRSN